MSRKNPLDQFSSEEEPKKEIKPADTAWGEKPIDGEDAVCSVCDKVFSAPEGRPPIFCQDCKQGLAEILQL